MKTQLTILLLIISFNLSYSQCIDYKLQPSWSGIKEIGINFSEFYSIKYYDTLELAKIKKYSDVIIDSSKSYIVNRAGRDFYNKLVLESFKVYYFDDNKIKSSNISYNNLGNCGRILYELAYSYFSKDSAVYKFNVNLNSKGDIMKGYNFPNIWENHDFENIISPDSAVAIVDKQNIIPCELIGSICLEYNSMTNSFCYKIREDLIPQLKESIKYKIDVIYIDAQTGEIIKTEKAIGFMTE